MIIDYILLGLVCFILMIATLKDLKYKEVSNDLVVFLFIIGAVKLLFHLNMVIELGLGFFFALVFGSILFFTGSWGGADSKVMFSLGLILGYTLFVKFIMVFTIVMIMYYCLLMLFIFIKYKNLSKIKEGVPLLPIFLISYIFMLFLYPYYLVLL